MCHGEMKAQKAELTFKSFLIAKTLVDSESLRFKLL